MPACPLLEEGERGYMIERGPRGLGIILYVNVGNVETSYPKQAVLVVFFCSMLVVFFTLNVYPVPSTFAATVTNNTNIVLVHGIWSDGSIWSKVIPILQDAGHRVTAAQLSLRSLGDDIATVNRAIEGLGRPTILVGHSYGGVVITNAGYNNPNVTGLVYIAALAPDKGESTIDLFEILPQPENILQMFTNNIIIDSAGFSYFNPDKFGEWFAHDVHPDEANVLAAVQKLTNESITTEKSGPPTWKQLPTWYQVSENDRVIPPNIQRLYAERMNATILSLNSSHMSPVSQPEEIAELIMNATKGSTK
jgi:pimeloyl-ACP methyl ester carboxylesterase